jgi:hypothetical protein
MKQKFEITGGFRRDEDEACRSSGAAELDASERYRYPSPRKPDPFRDVEIPKGRVPRRPNPFNDFE